MKYIMLFLERITGDIAMSAKGILEFPFCRLWSIIFVYCYERKWVNE